MNSQSACAANPPKTGNSCDRTKSEINVPKQVITGWKFPAPVRINVIWNPRRDPTDRKCEGGHRRGIDQVRRRSQQSEVISWLRSPLQSWLRCRSCPRVAHEQAKRSQKQPRRHHQIKCPMPVEQIGNFAAESVAERTTHRHRKIKVGQRPPPPFYWIQVGQNCWRGGAVSCFPDSDKRAGAEQDRKRPGHARPSAGETPECDADCDEPPPRDAIGQPT